MFVLLVNVIITMLTMFIMNGMTDMITTSDMITMSVMMITISHDSQNGSAQNFQVTSFTCVSETHVKDVT